MESDQKRALAAVILSGLVLFGWQKFFAPVNVDLKVIIVTNTVYNKDNLALNQSQSQLTIIHLKAVIPVVRRNQKP